MSFYAFWIGLMGGIVSGLASVAAIWWRLDTIAEKLDWLSGRIDRLENPEDTKRERAWGS